MKERGAPWFDAVGQSQFGSGSNSAHETTSVYSVPLSRKLKAVGASSRSNSIRSPIFI